MALGVSSLLYLFPEAYISPMDHKTTTQLVEDPEQRRALMARVQSAIYALRRGELVRVVADDGAYLCLATEQVNSGNLERLHQLGTEDTFIAITAKLFIRLLVEIHGIVLPPWARLVAGTEDLWKGYRQFFATHRHMRFSVITFV